MRQERMLEKLVATQQEQADDEELRIAKAVRERNAREAQLQGQEEERKAAMLDSIVAHRESLVTTLEFSYISCCLHSVLTSMA